MQSQQDCPLSRQLQPRAWQSWECPGAPGTHSLGQSLARGSVPARVGGGSEAHSLLFHFTSLLSAIPGTPCTAP